MNEIAFVSTTTRAELKNKAYKLVQVEELKEHPQNPNNGDVDAIAESIRVNGFFGSCVVQESTQYVLAGNHRFRAAKKLGLTEIPVVYVDCDDAAAARIMAADNQTARLGKDDPEKLLRLLQGIECEYGDLIGTGYEQGAIERMLGELQGPKEFNTDTFDEPGEPIASEDDQVQYDTPLAIVLNAEQLQRWVSLRKAHKCRSDTEMLLRLMEYV